MSDLRKLDPDFQPSFDGLLEAKNLIKKISTVKPILNALLFGSSVNGKATANSDLDILLIIPDNENPKDYYKIVQAPFFSERATDWIIKTKTEFDMRKKSGGVCFVAAETGIVIANG